MKQDGGNKIMDNQSRRQIKQDSESQHDPSSLSQSRSSRAKKVGTIVTRKRSNTDAHDHSSQVSSTRNYHNVDDSKLPNPQPLTHVEPLIKINKDLNGKDNGGKLSGLGLRASRLSKHTRSKSYQEQRAQLQKELLELTLRKNQIESLRENKKKLKIKLNQLQVELKEIKNNRAINKMGHFQNTQNISKIHTLKQLKHPKLKPIKLRQNTKPQQQAEPQADKKLKKTTKNTQIRTQGHESSDEQQVVNYFYEAELHHKCLNCKHYHIKKEDVRIPSQVKNQFNL